MVLFLKQKIIAWTDINNNVFLNIIITIPNSNIVYEN